MTRANASVSPEERRTLEYWLRAHERAAKFFAKNGNLTSARQQADEADRIRALLQRETA